MEHKWEIQPTRWKVPTGIGDSQRFIIEPTLGLLGVLIRNLIGLILVPIFRLLSIGV